MAAEGLAHTVSMERKNKHKFEAKGSHVSLETVKHPVYIELAVPCSFEDRVLMQALPRMGLSPFCHPQATLWNSPGLITWVTIIMKSENTRSRQVLAGCRAPGSLGHRCLCTQPASFLPAIAFQTPVLVVIQQRP